MYESQHQQEQNLFHFYQGGVEFYNHILAKGHKPQDAREVLPLCTKTEICMCGFVSDWKHFFELRALDKTGPAHPDMKAIAVPLYKEFIKRGYIDELV